MKRGSKPVAVILLLAFISPGLWALSNCVEHSRKANGCKPNCEMMPMSMNPGDEIAQSSAAERSCCTISNGTPVSSGVALTVETYIQSSVPPAVMPAYALAAPVRVLSSEGKTAPLPLASSHQALFCVFLV